MKKFMYLLVATAIFMGCAKKEDDPSDPNKSNGGNNSALTELIISNVENAPATSVIDEVVLESNFGVLASAPWNGSTAKIILPTSVSKTNLASDVFKGLTVSDGNARFVVGKVVGRKSGETIGSFSCPDKSSQVADRFFVYADRELTVKGKKQEGHISYNYDLSLKKGWNSMLYLYKSGDDVANYTTTTTTSGLKWVWQQ